MQFKTETERIVEIIEHAESIGLFQTSSDVIEKIKNGEFTANQYVSDLSTHNFALEQLYTIAKEIYQNININTATGEALDILGDLRYVPRIQSQPAVVNLDVTVPIDSGEDINIPAGTSVILEDVLTNYGDYIVSEDVTISAGVSSAVVGAESVDSVFQSSLPVGAVVGLTGFPELSVTNSTAGTNGRNIEEDEVYRIRIQNTVPLLFRGGEDLLQSYLDNYTGLDSYKLIPLYDGVGSLKIVCDTLSSELDNIAAGVTAKCMIETDKPVLCVLPTSQTLSTLALTCTKGNLGTLSETELTQIIQAQVQTYVEGGIKRDGTNYKGMSIGEDFYPSQLIQYLQGQVPEVLNFSTTMTPVSVADLNQFHISEVTVTYA